MAVGRKPLAIRADAVIEVDLDLADRAIEIGAVDSIRAAVAEVVDVVDADAIFAGATGAIFAGATDAIFAGATDAIFAGATDAIFAGLGEGGGGFADAGAAARGAVAADLNIPRLSAKQCMEPKVICIPLSRSAYTERRAEGWRTYSKEPKRIDPLVTRASAFIADGAGATMIPTLVCLPTDGAN